MSFEAGRMISRRTIQRYPRRWSGLMVLGALAGLFSGLLTACSSSAGSNATGGGSGDPYTVVIVASLTGASGQDGTSAADGIQSAFDTINAAGGIGGHQIKVSIIDDESTTAGAQSAVRQALDANPVAVMDEGTSGGLLAVVPLLESAKIPVLSVSAQSPQFYNWLFGSVPTSPQTTVSQIGGMKAALGSFSGKNVAVVTPDTPAAVQTADAQKAAIIAAGGSSTVVTTPLGATSFDSGAANIVASKADAVLINDVSAGTIVDAKALLNAGFKGTILTDWDAASTSTFSAINYDKFYVVRMVASSDPGTVPYEAAKKYNHLTGSDQPKFTMGWILAYMLQQGLKKCGYPCSTGNAISSLQSLGTFSVPGATGFGLFSVSPTVHNILTKYQLFKWDSAKKAPVAVGSPLPIGSPSYTNS
jgi:branched-chain amino acid transport system substrate-binding protein